MITSQNNVTSFDDVVTSQGPIMKTKHLLFAVLATVWMTPASAVVLATFEEGATGGVGDQAFIDEFYNGGFDSQGNSGPDHGLQFGGTATGLNSGHFISFENEPSPDTVMYYARNPGDATREGFGLANFAQGFVNSISFFFSQKADKSTVQVFSGLNGSGTELESLTLMKNWQRGCDNGGYDIAALGGGGSSGDTYCNWELASLTFDEVARSIVFSDAPGKVLFDNLSLEPVPLPAAVWLFASGLLGFAAIRRRSQTVEG